MYLYVPVHTYACTKFRKWNTGLALKESWLDWDGLYTQLLQYCFRDMVLGCGDNSHWPCIHILFFNKGCDNVVNRFIHIQWRVTCTPHTHSLPSSPPYTHKWECGCINCACYIPMYTLTVCDSIVEGVVEVFLHHRLLHGVTWEELTSMFHVCATFC